MAQSTPTASSSSSRTEAVDRLVAVQLLLRPPEDAASHGHIQLVLSTLPATGGVAGREGWSTRGLLDRLRLTRGETSSSTGSDRIAGQKQQQRQRGKQRPQGQHSEQAGQGVATKSTGAEQQQQEQEQQEQAEDPLEGDMWSVMSRLKSATLAPKKAADGSAAGDPAGPDAMAAALQASAHGLQAKLLGCCQAVGTAAADATGPLGEDSPAVLELLGLLQGLLNHGLHSSSTGGSRSASANSSSTPAAGMSGSSSRGTTPEPGGAAGSSGVAAAVKVAASARDMLGGLLHGRQQSAFGVSCCCCWCTSIGSNSAQSIPDTPSTSTACGGL